LPPTAIGRRSTVPGRFLAEIRPTHLAVYLRYGVEEIKASFLNPNGGQLFTVSDAEGA
jgi:hypothetical protein